MNLRTLLTGLRASGGRLPVAFESSAASLCFSTPPPAMQEDALKLVLLALEDGSALSRKVLVLFVVQKLEARFPQASKTSIGHVVQLLYRASCFKVKDIHICTLAKTASVLIFPVSPIIPRFLISPVALFALVAPPYVTGGESLLPVLVSGDDCS